MSVDDKHKLIIDHDVTNKVNDFNQLERMEIRAKEILQVDEFDVIADKGYYDGAQIKACLQKGITLVTAVHSTFSSRNTGIPPTVPLALRSEFAKNNQKLWKAFLSRINASEPRLQSLEEVIKTIREFLMPVVEAVYQNADFQKMWDSDRGWI